MKHNIIIKKKNLEQQKRKNSLCQVLGNIIIINIIMIIIIMIMNIIIIIIIISVYICYNIFAIICIC